MSLDARDDRRLDRLGIDRVEELELLDAGGRLKHSIRELVSLLDRGVDHRTSFVEGTLLSERLG